MSERDPLQELWTQQAQEPFSMSLADVRTRAEHFQSRIRRRNWIEYAACVPVVAGFGWAALAIDNPIVQAACGLIILGTLYVAWNLATVAKAASKAEIETAASWAEFHRAELVRQRDALGRIWRWYLGPLVPGWVVFWIGAGLEAPGNAPWWVQPVVAVAGFTIGIALFFAIAAMNHRAARTLQAEIDALDRLRANQL